MQRETTFLLTNDDGIDAPGLATLRRAIESLGSAITVAPDRPWSGCGHQATTSRPLNLQPIDDSCYSLDGSPVDCSRVGLLHVAPDTRWVLAGVNEGGNLGADVHLSGTVAAAREACLLGKPAIAISQYIRKRPNDWEQSVSLARQVIKLLLERPPRAGRFWNVNLPQPVDGNTQEAECVFCLVDPNPLPVEYDFRDGKLHYRGRYQDRQRIDGHDIEVCFSGHIAISEVKLF